MITCREKITQDQVEVLQKFKDASTEIDSTRADYAKLLNFDLTRYNVDPSLPKEKQEGPVDMSTAENTMQTIVEVTIIPLTRCRT